MNSKDNSRDGSGFVDINLQKSTFVGSLEDGLFMMAKGDSAAFIVPADSFFLKTMQMNQLPPFIKSGDHIKAVIKLGNIKGKQEVEAQRQKEMAEREAMMKEKQALELPALEKYIAENKINVKPTATGLYYIETKKGSGANPKPTDFVKVHYTGTLLDGKVFDSSVERGEPVEFPLNGVIAGWTEVLQLMKKGGKAKLIIPSSLGYGGQEAGPIPMFSSLVFEVELIDINEAPKQEGNPNQMPGAQPH
jgi:FKBP-type peptidyl-prolyl cis-trans isomerase